MEAEDRGGDGPAAAPIDLVDVRGLVAAPAMIEVASAVDEGGGSCENRGDDGAAAAAAVISGDGDAAADVDGCELVTALEKSSGGGEAEAAVEDGGGSRSNENCGSGVGATSAPATVSRNGGTAAAVDDGGCGSSENKSADGATVAPIDRVDGCGLVAVPVNLSCNGEAAAAASINHVDSCELVAAPAMVSCEQESAPAVDDGAGRSSENRGGDGATLVPINQVAAPAMISVGREMAADVDDGRSSGRKKGRPPRGQVRALAAKKVKVEEEEEDVCFICFDGGSLVLCDRRGCPKAYHPACVKRDEAFFQSKAKWNCGWHICSICQKAAYHMCYTCTYSLCKSCAKDADYLSVRENKGLCATCMRTVMLIEHDIPGNKDTIQVDFDDKGSWEYLFKVYWMYLKGKLSLTLDELIQAKNPYKVAEPIVRKEQTLDAVCGSTDCKSSISDIPSRRLEVTDSKKRRIKEQRILPNIKDCQSKGKSSNDKSTTLSGSPEWATKELLEFVAHMRNGDVSVCSQFDIQGLLLEYIKRNNLRDPHRKSQIICDSRLMNLFFKPRVGHFEMLKLLEYHFLIKEDNQKENTLGNIIRTVPNQVEGGGNNESLLMIDKDKKRKTRKKGEERGPQTNLDEFAAIDVHNINLIYLRRNLMENLVTANGKFHDKVVGSIVRIRISCGDLKQDMYRLVQVIGTCKAAVPYKVGGKTVDVMLVILNLHKKETVAIDSISNQEFSEDECRRLRQSIKCGLVKRMTVGQVQDKARALQEVRLNDWLETEMLRLNHLRDRASEKGRKKELRECVEKIELLKTPGERQRKLNEKLHVHADPKMDPKCESDDDVGEVGKQKQVDQVKQRFSGFRKLGRVLISTESKNKQAKFNSDKGPSGRLKEKVHELPERKDAVVSETPTVTLSNSSTPSTYNSETEKLWHYRDPNEKIQGPFCLVQLRKWSTTGYFPPDMRVWNINTDEGDSLLLTDVLNGNFHKALPSRSSTSLPDRLYICEDRHSSSVNPTLVNDGKRNNGSWNCTSATSVHQITVHEDRRWISGTTNGNLSLPGNTLYPPPGHENQSDSQHFSGQSSVGSWRPLAVNIASNNSDSNFSLASVAKSADSSDHLKMKSKSLPSPTPKTTCKDRKPSQSCSPVQDVVMEELPSPTPKLSDNDKKDDLGSQNLPCPSPMEVDVDEKVDSSFENSPNLLPNDTDRDERIQATENKPPGTNWTSASSTSTPSGTNEKDLQNPLPNTVDGDEIVNLGIQNLPSLASNPRDGDEKYRAHECKPPVTSLTFDSITSKPCDRDEKSGVGIQNPSTKVFDGDGKVDSTVQNLPSSPRDPSNGNEKVHANESKRPGTLLAFSTSTEKLSGKDEKAGAGNHNLSCLSPKTVDEDGKVDSTIQNFPSLPQDPRDGSEKVQANESKPPGTGLTCTSSPLKLSNGDEKAGIGIQNLRSPSPRTVDEDVKVNLTVQSLPSSPSDPSENEKVQAHENEPPSTSLTCSYSPREPSYRDENAGICNQNLLSLSAKAVGGDEKADLPFRISPRSLSDLKDGNEKIQVNKSKPPGTSMTCTSGTLEPNDRVEEANVGIQNLPSPSPKMVDGDEKVDSRQNISNKNDKVEINKSNPSYSRCTSNSILVEGGGSQLEKVPDEWKNGYSLSRRKPTEASSDQFATPASVCDQLAPFTSCHPPSTSNWRTFDYEPIELSTLAEESVSDLLAEVDAMEAQGEVASPTSAMYAGDDFFEDSKGDYFASIRGMGHLFNFGKTDDVSSTGESSTVPCQSAIISELPGPHQCDIFDPMKRSNGEASTSTGFGVVTRHDHNSGSHAENCLNNCTSSETRPMDINWGNINPGFGGLTQGMTYMGWGSTSGLAQVNMDMNRNTLFGFVGHGRNSDPRDDGGGSRNYSRP